MNSWYRLLGACLFFLMAPVVVLAQSASQSFTINQFYGDPPTEPPSVPADVVATPIASSQIDVSWSASTHVAPVVGYQVFRDLIQVATTSLTTFSDTGLQASTTYSYTIRAFDGFGNVSSSSVPVATTTFALPPPPPTVAPTTTPSRPPSGRAPDPELRSFNILPGTQSARIEFVTNVPTQFILRYGIDDVGSDGFVQTDRFASEHTTVLIDLEPGQRYVYELYIVDRFGREVLARQGEFSTEPRFVIVSPENVRNLRADTLNSDVLLRWQNPPQDNFAYVRVVRNHRFFPADPWDGFVVYEGRLENVTDGGALSQFGTQFYTVFSYDLDGNVSSGAVVVAQRFRDDYVPGTPLPEPMKPLSDDELPATTTDPETVIGLPSLRITDVEVVQFDSLVQVAVDSLELQTEEPFLLRIPYDSVPQHLKVIVLTIGNIEGLASASYLLRANADKTYYEARVAGLSVAGEYPVVVTVYDLENETLHTIRGTLLAFAVDETGVVEERFVTYWLIGGVLAMFLAGVLLWLWLLLLKNRRTDEEE